MKKMLFVFNYPSGGVETLSRQRSSALAPHNIQFDLLYSTAGPGLQNINNESTYVLSNKEDRKKLILEGNYEAIIVCSNHQDLEIIRSFGYDGILIYEIQGLGPIMDTQSYLKHEAKPNINSYANAILTPHTPHLMTITRREFPNKHRYHFNNCINYQQFTNSQPPKEPYPIIGWVGRIEPNKNWREFIHIYMKLVQSNPELRAWMFLDSKSYYPEDAMKIFKELLKKNSSLKNCHAFYDIPHNQMPDYYSRIAGSGGFLCSTTITEGFGYALLEAMCCECPILTTNSDGISSFTFHNRTGQIYQQGDIKKAVMEAQNLLHNEQHRQLITKKAVRYVRNHFSPQKYARKFLAMMSELESVQ